MPQRADLQIRPVDPLSPAAQRLLELADRLAEALYPPASNHLESADALALPNVTFIGAYDGPQLIACGAIKRMDDDGRYGEIKRVFTVAERRGRGIARAIMRDLEARLRDEGIGIARLETGIRQPAALALYRGLGYVERVSFGHYRDDPLSVFMEKRLI